ncbi:MAG: esterase family protein [Deltaproteobacteria bacterium]|nr:esterase family protein [Deltaproteobacteria bacterium]
MNIEYHKWWSPNLGQDMEMKVYGHAGKPLLVFPTRAGKFYEYEDYGMVEVCKPWIDDGKLQLFTVDSVDAQSWLKEYGDPRDKAIRHQQYESYVIHEVFPFIRGRGGEDRITVTGCSFGAFHTVNFYLRHPDLVHTAIALSGPFHPRFYIGDYMDDNVYFNAPLAYLPNLADPWFLDWYRRSRLVVCVGQGYWEDKFLADTLELKRILEEKQIPAWIDIWGHDVAHDWPWWRKMIPHFLKELGY